MERRLLRTPTRTFQINDKTIIMNTTRYIIISTILLLASCGIPQDTYNKLKKQNDSLLTSNQSLQKIITGLETRIDELQNGETRLINLIENTYTNKDYISTSNYIDKLLSHHPESSRSTYYQNLKKQISPLVQKQLKAIEQQRKDSIRLSNINNLGIWEIQYFVDEFGNKTNEPYITTTVHGTFSNSATENSRLRVTFIISSRESIGIQLFEYDRNNPVKGYRNKYNIHVLDSKGNKTILSATNFDSDRLMLSTYGYKEKSSAEKLHQILRTGGKIQFMIEDADRSITRYNFNIENADWYDNAYTKLQLIHSKKSNK